MQPLKEQITALLEALELNFEFDEENNLFRLNFETENAPVHVCISYDDERKLIINRSSTPCSLANFVMSRLGISDWLNCLGSMTTILL